MSKILMSILMIVIASIAMSGQQSIMTYNIRYNTQNDGVNWWKHRKSAVVDMINHYRPDIFGIQEGLHSQVEYLNNNLPEYNYVGVGRDDGQKKGEYTAIFFRKEVIQLIKTKTYWLSEHPDLVSVGWDASMERIVTYGKFRDTKTGNTLHVFNCHYDHIGTEARKQSSNLILQLIRDMHISEEAIAVIGDLNCESTAPPISILSSILEDSYRISQSKPYGPEGTFNGFKVAEPMNRRIDYILTKNLKVKRYINIDDRRNNNLWLSDHTPVMIDIKP